MERIGELAALATAVAWSLTSIYFTIATRHLGALSLNRVRLALAVVFLGGLHVATEGAAWPTAEAWRWAVLGASGVLGLTVGDTLLFHAFRTIGPRKSMILMSTVPILSAGLAFAWLGETIGGVDIVGIFAVVVGVVVVVAERSPGPAAHGESFGRGVVAALGAAAAQAVSLVIVKQGLTDGFSSVSATWMRMLVAAADARALPGRVRESARDALGSRGLRTRPVPRGLAFGLRGRARAGGNRFGLDGAGPGVRDPVGLALLRREADTAGLGWNGRRRRRRDLAAHHLAASIPSSGALAWRAVQEEVWRECMGIEPTRGFVEPPTGFEVQEAHQKLIHSRVDGGGG